MVCLYRCLNCAQEKVLFSSECCTVEGLNGKIGLRRAVLMSWWCKSQHLVSACCLDCWTWRLFSLMKWTISASSDYSLFELSWSIFTAQCYASAVYAVMQCLSVRPSVCPSVTFVDHVKTNKDFFEIFLPSGSDTILVFLSQRGCQYSDGNPTNRGIECKGGMIKWRLFHKYLPVSQKR